MEGRYRYNPLHNDLEAYALAYGIASLLNNLFGKGKEPFWQQAYTNLVKFIILLHKVNYDYVTLFDVYECAINPEVLESRIRLSSLPLTAADGNVLALAGQRRQRTPAALVGLAIELLKSFAHHAELCLAISIEHARFALTQHLRHEVIRDAACAESGRERVPQLIQREVPQPGAFQSPVP